MANWSCLLVTQWGIEVHRYPACERA